jgi:hypothetical protein
MVYVSKLKCHHFCHHPFDDTLVPEFTGQFSRKCSFYQGGSCHKGLPPENEMITPPLKKLQLRVLSHNDFGTLRCHQRGDDKSDDNGIELQIGGRNEVVMDRCSTCRFFHDKLYECRKNTPKSTRFSPYLWPKVDPKIDFCGQWKEKEVETANAA